MGGTIKVAEEIAQVAPATSDAVSDPIQVWAERNYQSTENPLHSEFVVNGTTIDIFSSDARKPIAKFLKNGWNTIEIKTAPQVPANRRERMRSGSSPTACPTA